VATGEDRRLGDFFTNSVGLDGCVQIASGDITYKDPTSGGELPTSRPIFLRQDAGPRLRGSGDCSGAADPNLGLPGTRKCKPRRLTLRLRGRRVRVKLDGKRVKVVRRKGKLRAKLVLRGRKRHVVRITGRTRSGKKIRIRRVYRTCAKK
jgi:hypothetical protein